MWNRWYRQSLKRWGDFILVMLSFPVWGPLLAVVALTVRWKLGRNVIFSQTRPGLHGQPFRLHKFRSMTDARDAFGNLLPDAERLTSFGRWLRSTSLDELPELWNVLRGEMSLVGPRPLLMEYLDRFSAEQARRHDVRPGLTGWAQINGRNATTWPDRLARDVWYVDHVSFLLDSRILTTTISKVWNREGISAANEATMPLFLGNGQDRTAIQSCNKAA